MSDLLISFSWGSAVALLFGLWTTAILRTGFVAQAERRRWRPVFRAGVYEYQQHEDGRRRAVRVASGEGDLDTLWLLDGAQVDI